MERDFAIDDLLKVAKRENNQKRPYLYVNPLQGKHVPASPSVTLELFSRLAGLVERRYAGESLLAIGFAETATAIGFTVAWKAENVKYVMSTTRENLEGAGYLFFTESHSHATEQRLISDGLAGALEGTDRVVFVEDEVTTGNTIEKLIRALENSFPDKGLKFGIASILNSMSDGRLKELETEGIPCDYLHRIPSGYRVEEVERYHYDELNREPAEGKAEGLKEETVPGGWNGRKAAAVPVFREKCGRFAEELAKRVCLEPSCRSLLVLGTEEFMFPALLAAAAIENRHPEVKVRFHATTRSPIEISDDPEYPLHNRAPLESLYEKGRRTFLYNLTAYDKALVVTDAEPLNTAGLLSLTGALEQHGNRDITLIRWEDSADEEQLFR